MVQILFIIGCLLVPALNDWTTKCRTNEAGGANEAGGMNERGRGTE